MRDEDVTVEHLRMMLYVAAYAVKHYDVAYEPLLVRIEAELERRLNQSTPRTGLNAFSSPIAVTVERRRSP